MKVHWRQSGINSAGARRGFSGILLQNTYIFTNLKQIPGDSRKSGGASAPPAPPSLAPMCICILYILMICSPTLIHEYGA